MKATVVRSMMCMRIGKLIVLHVHVADGCDDFLQNKKDSDGSKVILKDVWGSIPNGRVTAIMGPSGAGKVRSNMHVDILIAASRLHGAHSKLMCFTYRRLFSIFWPVGSNLPPRLKLKPIFASGTSVLTLHNKRCVAPWPL